MALRSSLLQNCLRCRAPSGDPWPAGPASGHTSPGLISTQSVSPFSASRGNGGSEDGAAVPPRDQQFWRGLQRVHGGPRLGGPRTEETDSTGQSRPGTGVGPRPRGRGRSSSAATSLQVFGAWPRQSSTQVQSRVAWGPCWLVHCLAGDRGPVTQVPSLCPVLLTWEVG